MAAGQLAAEDRRDQPDEPDRAADRDAGADRDGDKAMISISRSRATCRRAMRDILAQREQVERRARRSSSSDRSPGGNCGDGAWVRLRSVKLPISQSNAS